MHIVKDGTLYIQYICSIYTGETMKRKTVVITLKVDYSLLERIDEIAEKTGRSRSDLIREGLLEVLRKYSFLLDK